VAGEGPEVYRLSRAYRTAAAQALIERALGTRVVRIERDTVSGSHGVFFATLANGETCVARIATHPEHDLARELWAMEQCRRRGVPVPTLLAAETSAEPPYAIMRRVRGVPAHGTVLDEAERRAVFQQLGQYAAQIHSIALPGFGELAPSGAGYAGRESSLWEYLRRQLRSAIEVLPGEVLPPALARSIEERFERESVLLDREAVALLHGDYHLKNVLLDGARVSAVLDFEMAAAGDPATDLALLLYSDSRGTEDEGAVLRGYAEGGGSIDDGFERRLLLHQIPGALVHLWWLAAFGDHAGIKAVLERIQKIERMLDRREW